MIFFYLPPPLLLSPPSPQVHWNAESFPIKGDNLATLYRCCRRGYCSGGGRVKKVAEFDDSHVRGGGITRSCNECKNKQNARDRKTRAARVEAADRAKAAILAESSSRVPRSPEEKAELKGGLHQAKVQAEQELAAVIAAYGRGFFKELVQLRNENPRKYDEELDKMTVEAAAKVQNVVQAAALDPDLLGE